MLRKLVTFIEQANQKLLFWLLVAVSIVLAARMQAIQHGWINPDSVLYLEAAKLIAVGDWQGAYKIFNWPFYALCIGLVHKLTNFDVQFSAQILNMVFFGIATASFLKIIQLAGGKNLAIFSGALLLFSNLYIVGDVLEMLMRDVGFWAFYLTSLIFFIRFYQHDKIADALLWQLTTIVAVLFRIEAITFLLFLPLFFIFTKEINYKQRLKKLVSSYSISLFTLSIIFIAINSIDSLNIENFGRLNEIFNTNLWDIFTKNIIEKSAIMAEQVLGEYLEEYAIVGLLLTFAYVILVKNFTTLGLVGIVLVGLHFKNKFNQINRDVKRVLTAASIICVINMALIITKVFVLSSRYVVALTLILLIIAALYLGHLLKKTKENRQTHLTWLVAIIVVVMCLSIVKNVLPKRPGYNYRQEAASWVTNNSSNHTVFYDDSRLRYYAGEPFISNAESSWKKLESKINTNTLEYDYLVLSFSNHDKLKADILNQKLPNYKEIKRFYAPENKKYCAIYIKKY